MLSFKEFLRCVESQNDMPETDDEAKVRLPQDVRLQAAYDQMRKRGRKPGQAFNSVIQTQWQSKKAMSN